MSRVSHLDHLQSIDQELDEATRHALKIEQDLAGDPALVAARSELDAENKRLAELRALIRNGELETKSIENKMASIQERLYSGRVANPKELDGLEKELQMHKRQRSQVDDRMLQLFEEVDQAQASVNDKASRLAKSEGTRAGDVERLRTEKQDLESRRARLAAEREHTRALLDPGALRTFDHLEAKLGQPVARIRHEACGRCGVAVPTGLIQRARTGNELVMCSGCGRILVG